MNKVLIATGFMILMAACGQAQQHKFDITGFEEYYSEFSTAGNISTDNLVIQFSKLRMPGERPNTIVIGFCAVSNGVPTVSIDRQWWEAQTDGAERAELIWHELGHCLLGRVHDDSVFPDGKPKSIMNTQHFSATIVKDNINYYTTELFTKGAQ